MTKLSRITAVLVALLAVLLATPAFAGDPPSRVMRLNYMSGQVSFQPGGVDDWVAATLNRPLTSADRVWTDKNSRAELNLGTGSLRMDSETSLTLSNVSDNTVQVELDQGVLNIHVRRLYGGEIYEVDTPNVAFTLLKAGDYRFEVDPIADTTTVIVRRGKGEGNGNGRGVEVESGEMARFEHGNTMMHTMARAPRLDGFDDWCQVRNQREDRSYESARYVSDDTIGYEDLDDNGYWRSVPTYGYVWYPRTVIVGWAPYRYGHWAWIEPWGWTWVDDAPWGFAPFHYGRWVYSSYGWGWCPGPRHYRPIYSPALVAWFGGSHWGVGFGGGYGVGWVPLGWGEPYYPYYHVSRNYVREVNIRNTRITNINYVTNNYYTVINNRNSNNTITHIKYVNQNGMTTVPAGTLEHGRPVPKSMVALNERERASGQFIASPEVAPRRGGVLGGRADAPAALPPSMKERRVVTKMTPPERPEKFEARQPYIERNHGMAVDKETMAEMRKNPAPARDGDRGRPAEAMRQGENSRPAEVGRPAEAGKPMNADRGRPSMNDNRPAANIENRGPANADNGNKSVNADVRPGNGVGRQVPRPPLEDGRRVITLDGSGADNSAKGNGRQTGNDVGERNTRFVPRPPAERRPASGAEGAPGNAVRQGVTNAPDTVARPTAEKSNPAPENRRSAIFDRNDNAGQRRKTVEAEVTSPRSVPRPPEGNAVRTDNGDSSSRTMNSSERRSTPDASERRSMPDRSERRPTPDTSDRRPTPDTSERRVAPPPQQERRVEPRQERERPQPQREERHAAPPADKQHTEPAKKTSSLMDSETPRNAESSRSAFVHKPPYAGQSFAPRESAASFRDTSYSSRESSFSPRTSSWDRRESGYSSPVNSFARRESYSPRTSYSSGSTFARSERISPSYSRSSNYSAGSTYSRGSNYSRSSSPRSSSGHAATSSFGGGRASGSASRGNTSSHSSRR